MFREEQGNSRSVGKSRFNVLCSVAKNGKKGKKKSLLFLQMSVQKLFFSQFLKKQKVLNPNNVQTASHFHAKQIFIFVSLEKSVGNNL